MAAWTPSGTMRDAAWRQFSILATVWMSFRMDSEEPDRAHGSLLVALRQALTGLTCDLVLYRDEDMLLSRSNGVLSVSRRLFWDAADEATLGIQGYRLVD